MHQGGSPQGAPCQPALSGSSLVLLLLLIVPRLKSKEVVSIPFWAFTPRMRGDMGYGLVGDATDALGTLGGAAW